MSDEQQSSPAERFAEEVLTLAQRYAAEQEAARRRTLSIDERLAEAGRIRAAWKAVEAELPALIAEAEARGGPLGLGLRVNNIADRLSVTESYVYRKLRDAKQAKCNALFPADHQEQPARCERQPSHEPTPHRGRGGDGVHHDWPAVP